MIITGGKLILDSAEYDILEFNYHFQRDTDAKGRPCGVYYGGEMLVRIESADDTRILQQMIHKDVPPSRGSIEIYGMDDRCVRRIEFEKAYIYAVGEQLSNCSWLPMTTTICISPLRLDFNKVLRLDRRWPYANGWEHYKPEQHKGTTGQAVEEDETEVSEIEVVTPLTKKEPNPRAGMEFGETYTLRVKSYTRGTPRQPGSIRWEYSYNTNKEEGEVVVGALIEQRGEEITFTVKDEAAVGCEICFYAYLSKQKKEGQCGVYVNPLWRYKGTKEWGKLGLGLERKSQRLSLEQMKREIKLDEAGMWRAETLSMMPEQAVRNMYEGNTNISGVRQVLSDDDNLQARVLNSFYTGAEPKMSFGPTSMLSQKLKVNPTFQEYYKRYLDVIKTILENQELDIEKIDGEVLARLFGDQDTYKKASKPNFSKVKEIFKYDYYGLMGGTQKIKVDLDIMQTGEHAYIVKTRMYIGDWYGADEGDINGLTSLKGNVGSLNAFFWLQHHYGCHPFETEIIYESIDRIQI